VKKERKKQDSKSGKFLFDSIFSISKLGGWTFPTGYKNWFCYNHPMKINWKIVRIKAISISLSLLWSLFRRKKIIVYSADLQSRLCFWKRENQLECQRVWIELKIFLKLLPVILKQKVKDLSMEYFSKECRKYGTS